MTNDTLKSLGYLKKSLRMNLKALKNNLGKDNIDSNELDIFIKHSTEQLGQIDSWEKANVVVPFVVVQPASAAATVNTVPDSTGVGAVPTDISDISDDLLTID